MICILKCIDRGYFDITLQYVEGDIIIFNDVQYVYLRNQNDLMHDYRLHLGESPVDSSLWKQVDKLTELGFQIVNNKESYTWDGSGD